MRRGGNDEGYTLAECVVALLVLGLAMAGLSAGVISISRQQARAVGVARAERDLRYLHEDLDRLLEGQGPFIESAGAFSGTSSGFRFRCAPIKDCGAWLAMAPGGMALHLATLDGQKTLPMPGARSAQFVYASPRTVSARWPTNPSSVQPLKSIGLLAKTDTGSIPLANAQVWIDQSPYCDFDPVIKDCRR